MKKIALVALVATSAAVAAPFNGFSVGANVGASFNKITLKATRTGDSASRKTNTLIGGIFVGYTKSFNNVIAGLDLGLGMESKKTFKDDEGDSITFKPGLAFTFAPRVGYKFNDTTAAYFKLGMEMGKNEIKVIIGAGNRTVEEKEKKTAFSVAPTLGMEKAFGNVSVRGEVGYKMTAKKTYLNGLGAKRNAVIMTIGASYNF